MSRSTAIALAALLVGVVITSSGCKELKGRSGNREGNRAFREMRFVDSAGSYETALTTVEDPIIHYNLGLAYSKVMKVGADPELPILLGIESDSVCKSIPGVKLVPAQVCVKKGDRTFTPCDAKSVCASSFECKQANYCSLTSPQLAQKSAEQFEKWLDAHQTDDDTRKMMTQNWINAELYDDALKYWTERLAQKPNDPAVMGILAGINLKAGDYKKSIEWYNKVADASTDEGAKVGAYGFIGNVAWAKLHSNTLDIPATIELADIGLGALQKAAELEPKTARFFGLQASLYNFRSLSQGASFAAAIDRANAQDLQKVSSVLNALANPKPATPPPPPDHGSAAGSGAGSGSAAASGSGSAAGSGSGSAAGSAGSAEAAGSAGSGSNSPTRSK